MNKLKIGGLILQVETNGPNSRKIYVLMSKPATNREKREVIKVRILSGRLKYELAEGLCETGAPSASSLSSSSSSLPERKGVFSDIVARGFEV